MCIERSVYSVQRKRLARCAQAGASLLELIAFIAIVGASLAGVLSVLNVTSGHSADPMVRKQMLVIAESLIDEVASQPFTVCDPTDLNAATATTTAGCASASKTQGFGHDAASGTTRSLYNNVGNYCNETGTNGTTCTPLALGSPTVQIQDLTLLNPAPLGYYATVQLFAEPLGAIASAATSPATMEVLRIQVIVYYFGTSEHVMLESYRTRWMPHL